MIPEYRAFYCGKMYAVSSLRFKGNGKIGTVEVRDRGIGCRCWHDVSIVQLMQSVGFKDKNGVESFKDDIIKTADDRIWIIKHGTFFWHVPKSIIELYGFYLLPIPNEDNHPIPIYENFGEIIGNKWENPELLELSNKHST